VNSYKYTTCRRNYRDFSLSQPFADGATNDTFLQKQYIKGRYLQICRVEYSKADAAKQASGRKTAAGSSSFLVSLNVVADYHCGRHQEAYGAYKHFMLKA
jgi:hypothetical protein